MEPNTATPERHCYFDYRYLQYLKAFIAKKDVRYYLEGAFITPVAEEHGGGVMLAATDGHRLIAIHHKEGYTNGNHILRMPNIKVTKKIIDAMRGYASPFGGVMDRVEYKGDQLHHCAIAGQKIDEPLETRYDTIISEVSKPIDARFPNVKRVFPSADKLHVGRFCVNGEYMAILGKLPAFKRGMKCISGHENAVSVFEPAWTPDLPTGDRVVALIMPMRCDNKDWEGFALDWIPDLPGATN